MIQHEEIKETKKRSVEWVQRFVPLPALTPPPTDIAEHGRWLIKNHWMTSYTVHMDDKPRAVELSKELYALLLAQSPDKQKIEEILSELRALRTKDRNQFTDLDTWTANAQQLVNFAGDQEVWKSIILRLDKYEGMILEAMCGHHTYYPTEKPNRTVIALDYCLESLKKLQRPERRRILCDLNQIVDCVQLPFFEEDSLDVISICFGFRYPINIIPLLKEFRRILKPGGTMSFIENPGHGYPELCKRDSDPSKIIDTLNLCGFKIVTCHNLVIPSSSFDSGREKFCHVEGIK